jgi:hypothetical protein
LALETSRRIAAKNVAFSKRRRMPFEYQFNYPPSFDNHKETLPIQKAGKGRCGYPSIHPPIQPTRALEQSKEKCHICVFPLKERMCQVPASWLLMKVENNIACRAELLYLNAFDNA